MDSGNKRGLPGALVRTTDDGCERSFLWDIRDSFPFGIFPQASVLSSHSAADLVVRKIMDTCE